MELFQNFGEKGIIDITTEKDQPFILKIYIANKDMKVKDEYQTGNFDFNILTGLFLPAVFFISLVAAISISWKRKIAALFTGLLLFLLYDMLRLRIILMHYFSANVWMGIYQSSDEKASINFWYRLVALHETPEFTFALILWMFLCIGKKEWQQLNGTFEKVAVKKKIKTRR